MKKHRNPILQGTASRVRQILERFEESKAIRHDATKGSLREAYLKDFLAGFVPPGLAISSGFITDSRGADISPQLDLLIYDTCSLPSFVMSAFSTIVPVEASRLSIEVKSNLKQEHFEQIRNQQETIRKMLLTRTAQNRKYLSTMNCPGLPQFVVAFETACSQEALHKWFADEAMLEVICVIGHFSMLRDPSTKIPEVVPSDDDYLDVMQFVTRLQSSLLEVTGSVNSVNLGTPEGTLPFQPDFGAYLTFDVPDSDYK
jgi:hypothetical protein